jgi:ADP-ribose pyrophosphatase YjhB (NUDIX family)
MKYTIDENRNWYNALPAKRSSSGMVVRHNDTVLMVKDDYKPAMTFPGGVIDPNESPASAAIRETFEEVGLQLDPDDVTFFSVGYIPEKSGFLDRYHFFFATTISNVTKRATAHEKSIEYVEWVPVDQIAARSGDRPTYVALQHMLTHGSAEPYFEISENKEGGQPWQT